MATHAKKNKTDYFLISAKEKYPGDCNLNEPHACMFVMLLLLYIVVVPSLFFGSAPGGCFVLVLYQTDGR